MNGHDIVVGRQPIFNRNLSIVGYELLFRTIETSGNFAPQGNGDQMTAEVLFGSVSIGIDRLVGDKKVFCNASRGVLTGDVPILLPPERTVVEILETIVPDEDVIEGCTRLAKQGYKLALDDFTWFEGVEPLLELASIVKIDLRLTPVEEIPVLLEKCRPFRVDFLAEKIETNEEMANCAKLGFDYFQGYLLAKPRIVPGRAIDPGNVQRLRLLSRLLDRECPIRDLEEIVRADPAMTHQLLQLAGIGAAKGMMRTVRNVREALVIVGWRRLQSWVSLLMITNKGIAAHEGMTNVLTRARMCELAAGKDPQLSGDAFVAGMVSGFDLLLDMPLSQVLETMPLDDDLRCSVLHGEGPLGRLVADVRDYLTGSPEESVRSDIDETILAKSALDALTWAIEVTTAFNAVG